MTAKQKMAVQKPQSEHTARSFDISSASNPKYRLWKTLLDSRGIKRYNMALVSGTKLVPEVLRLRPEIAEGLIFNARYKASKDDFPYSVPRYRLSGDLFRDLDVFGTAYPLLLVNIPPIPEYETGNADQIVSLLVPFQDPANVGAVIRSAAAFGIHSIVLLTEAALPFHPKSIRAGGSAVFLVSYVKGPSINDLNSIDVPIVALSTAGISLDRFTFPDKFVLLPGLEGPGLPGNVHADFIVSIPMDPYIESLNAAVAASIVLYEYQKRRR